MTPDVEQLEQLNKQFEEINEQLAKVNEQFAELLNELDNFNLEPWLDNELSKRNGTMSLAEIDEMLADMDY